MRLLPYRFFFFLNIMVVCVLALVISASAIYFMRNTTITEETIGLAEEKIERLAFESEGKLSAIEGSLLLLNRTVEVVDLERFAEIMDETIWDHKLIRTIYVLDNQGVTVAVGTRESRTALHTDYTGIDFSQTPLFHAIQQRKGESVWSDIFVSILSGDTSVGVGVTTNDYTVIAEISLQAVLGTLIDINDRAGRLWVIDGRGELIADTENSEEAGIQNVRTVTFMSRAVKGESLESVEHFDGNNYHVAYARSEKLGWLFLWGTPSGIHNERIQNFMYDTLLIALSFLILTLVISPFWVRQISSDVLSLKEQAEKIARNETRADVVETHVFEFHQLSDYMHQMQGEISLREGELIELNRLLESKVEKRTEELQVRNEELLNSMAVLQSMQETLAESEKHASLGRMVAGVAHELNTPIGNSLMALSSMRDEYRLFAQRVRDGLTKSELTRYLEFSDTGIDISLRNVQRAAELVTSFKHVANDQSSSIRRQFNLNRVVQDVLLTLSPMIKKTEHQVGIEIDSTISMNSYPGVVSQILTNLINNAFLHAWEGREGGELLVSAELVESPERKRITDEQNTKRLGWVEVSIFDNGVGIPDSEEKSIFDPFYTSKAGAGGTGLGLNIALNGARKILGGDLEYVKCDAGKGTTFTLRVPLTAPSYI